MSDHGYPQQNPLCDPHPICDCQPTPTTDRDELVERALETAHAISQYEPEQTAIGVMLTELANRIQADAATIAAKDAALTWYAEQVEGCRKIGSAGDAARSALDKDGGNRARAALKGGDHG